MAAHTQHRGFTLLELMIAVAVVAILASLAWPSWSNVLHRARRTEAQLALLGIQHAQERYFANHLRYAGSLQADSGLGIPQRTDSGDYQLQTTASEDGQTYEAVATADPQGRQQRDSHCLVLSINSLGERASSDASGHTTSVNCWR